MSALAISQADQASILTQVAGKYGIPITALLAIYGQETSFGQNVSTSSAGAMGPFQFMPATAAQWGYPLTNTPTLAQFAQQADAWGRFLVAGNPSKSASGWAPAMVGGYTQAQADQTLKSIPAGLWKAVDSAILAGGSGNLGLSPGPATPTGIANTVANATGLPSAADAIGSVWTKLTTPATWLRILEFIGGAVLIYMALKSLTGVSGPSLPKAIPVPV
jgi:hypothetical protein